MTIVKSCWHNFTQSAYFIIFFVSSISYRHTDLSLLKEFSKIVSFSNSYKLPSQSAVQKISMSMVNLIQTMGDWGRLCPPHYHVLAPPPRIFKPSYGPPNGSACCGWLAKRPIDFYILHAMMMPLKAAIYHSILYCLPTLFSCLHSKMAWFLPKGYNRVFMLQDF